jgi:glycosyltransferase involved in cell wall biosynthesis
LPQYHAAGIRTLVIPAYKPAVYQIEYVPSGVAWLVRPCRDILQKAVNFSKGLVGRAFYYARLLRGLNIDIVHLNNSIVRNHDWMLGAMLARVPCITHERGINKHYPLLARLLGRRLKAVVCISGAVRDNLKNHSLDTGNLVTIYNGIDPHIVSVSTEATDILQRQNIRPGTRIVGVIGNIKLWKGQETMIRALPLILRDVPHLVCLFVGDTAPADQAYHDHLLALAGELGVQENIRFTGYTRNVADYINTMEIVIHTSVEPEPFGRVLIEAMAMSKPVIGARGGAVTEIIEEGSTGLTFQPGNPAALAEAAKQFLLSPDVAAEMGIKGRARLLSEFNIQTNIRKTEEVYASILE